MGQCEICGKTTELARCMIEGCEMSVCRNCARFGTASEMRTDAPIRAAGAAKTPARQEEEEPAIVNASAKVKDAREKKGLTQEQLAKAIAEKESVVHRIESGAMMPTLATAEKLEKFLGIKLIEKIMKIEGAAKEGKSESFTIGDLVMERKKK
ncbi:MAG TPA: TIGR00270 family protein [Nanoarchaeota archaeon]|nr:TIGR00270 family protein [Nanoarchaeota archaeon]